MIYEDYKVIKGDNYDNRIEGTKYADKIYGYGGDDYIYAKGGDDYVWGGRGDDHIWGGRGNDHAWGGSGNDYLSGVEPYKYYSPSGQEYGSYQGDYKQYNPGAGERDYLTGGHGYDTFALGDKYNVYYKEYSYQPYGQSEEPHSEGQVYNKNGGNSYHPGGNQYDDDSYQGQSYERNYGAYQGGYAVITDFNYYEDKIKLHGQASDYEIKPIYNGSNYSSYNDVGIYWRDSYGHTDLIGVVQNTTNLDLSAQYFQYV